MGTHNLEQQFQIGALPSGISKMEKYCPGLDAPSWMSVFHYKIITIIKIQKSFMSENAESCCLDGAIWRCFEYFFEGSKYESYYMILNRFCIDEDAASELSRVNFLRKSSEDIILMETREFQLKRKEKEKEYSIRRSDSIIVY